MKYTGIDYHKRYSVACTLNEEGGRVNEARIDANTPEGFAAYFKHVAEPSEVVIEACWNWAALYDLLEATEGEAHLVRSEAPIATRGHEKNPRCVSARGHSFACRGYQKLSPARIHYLALAHEGELAVGLRRMSPHMLAEIRRWKQQVAESRWAQFLRFL